MTLEEFFEMLYEMKPIQQEPLGEEFEQILYENLWDLYLGEE